MVERVTRARKNTSSTATVAIAASVAVDRLLLAAIAFKKTIYKHKYMQTYIKINDRANNPGPALNSEVGAKVT